MFYNCHRSDSAEHLHHQICSSRIADRWLEVEGSIRSSFYLFLLCMNMGGRVGAWAKSRAALPCFLPEHLWAEPSPRSPLGRRD